MVSPTNENYTGANLSGSTGQTNRVLTLGNTTLTVSNGLEIFVNGVFQTPTTNFTINHLAASSTITFLQARANSDLITVIYYISGPISGTYSYTDEDAVYQKTGLSASDVDLSTWTQIIEDAESELEMLTGRKFTNANTMIEFLDGAQKDALDQKATSVTLSRYPILSITGFLIMNVDGTTNITYDILTSGEIIAGTFESTDYWADTIIDSLTGGQIANGHLRLKSSTIPQGYHNVKVSYTYGYATVPIQVRALASCLAGVRTWVHLWGAAKLRQDLMIRLKDRLYKEFPEYKRFEIIGEDHKDVFSKIYDENSWTYGSGAGSVSERTGEYRNFLSEFMKEKELKTIVDLGCGDWQINKLIDWTGKNLIAVDVVESVMNKNKLLYSKDNIQFIISDARTYEIPECDLLIIKDVLMHWTNEEIKTFFKKKIPAKYILITNDSRVDKVNSDIEKAGQWRNLDITKEPFNLKAIPILNWRDDPKTTWIILT